MKQLTQEEFDKFCVVAYDSGFNEFYVHAFMVEVAKTQKLYVEECFEDFDIYIDGLRDIGNSNSCVSCQ